MKLETLYFVAAIVAPTITGFYYFLSNRLYFVSRFHQPLIIKEFDIYDHEKRTFKKELIQKAFGDSQPMVFPITISNTSRRDFDVFKIVFKDQDGNRLQFAGLEKERYIDHGFIDFFDINNVPYKLDINESAIIVVPGQRSVVINSLVNVPKTVTSIHAKFSYINVGVLYALTHFLRPIRINKDVSKQIIFDYPIEKNSNNDFEIDVKSHS